MNIRKALEKAEKIRNENSKLTWPEEQVQKNKFEELDWKPPKYTKSKNISYDINKMIENKCILMSTNSQVTESYKILKTRIQYFLREKNANTLLVTSPNPEEGKSLTAANLSLSLAESYNNTVLLIDCDLRRQKIHKLFGIENSLGIADLLIDGIAIEDLITWPMIDKFTFISGSRIVNNSSELLSSNRMKSFMRDIKERYNDRIIILDSPPLLTTADTIALFPIVDVVIMVVREAKTTIKSIEKALDIIPKEKFLGFVNNCKRANKSEYYYYR